MTAISTIFSAILLFQLIFYCAGDVDNSGIVDDTDMIIIRNNFDFETDSIFDVVPAAVSYGDVCDRRLYLPVIIKS